MIIQKKRVLSKDAFFLVKKLVIFLLFPEMERFLIFKGVQRAAFRTSTLRLGVKLNVYVGHFLI